MVYIFLPLLKSIFTMLSKQWLLNHNCLLFSLPIFNTGVDNNMKEQLGVCDVAFVLMLLLVELLLVTTMLKLGSDWYAFWCISYRSSSWILAGKERSCLSLTLTILCLTISQQLRILWNSCAHVRGHFSTNVNLLRSSSVLSFHLCHTPLYRSSPVPRSCIFKIWHHDMVSN